MKVQDFLEHHGISRNPFAEEDAQTDPVFKEHCIDSTYHPTWDKVYGDPAEPASAIVFGEKGSGKTAMRLQLARHLEQYNRETSFNPSLPVPADIELEQKKINRAEGLVFIYPVWWSDCPAKLKGWFDRVWTLGYAYSYENGNHVTSEVRVKKALVICPAGHPVEYLEETGVAPSMRCIMLNDRLRGVGIGEAQMEILGGMVSQDQKVREQNLTRARELGKTFDVIKSHLPRPANAR